MARTRETARKTTACRSVLNHRATVIQAYENYEIDPTHTLIEHVEEVFARWVAARGVGHKITPLQAINNLIHTLPPQWGDMGIVVRDEMLEGNPPEHPERIEFELYCETFLDRWISTLEPEPEPEEDLEENPEEEPSYESNSDNEPEYVPGQKPELEPEQELGFELDPELEVDQESEPESCTSLDDEAPPSKLRRIQNVWTIEDED
ncbi:uncharacterized protein LOC111377830 [Olea europaea var. sylvestris]|uniref:uncharacterized protein LOC111377830 n=1 Tax=Olea europaea var. sylvestris TaxID=158386 RepID=UPI000C1D28C3|nr:uncharacterized protein LOC111377830 [Olea europaea var. sylvestris]